MVKKLIIALVLALAASLAWHWFFPSEEEKIRRQFREMAKLTSKEADESGLEMALKVRQLQEQLAPDVTIIVAEAEEERRYELKRTETGRPLIAFRNGFSSLRVSFHDMEVTITGQQQAQVSATLLLQTRLSAGEEPGSEAHLINCHLSPGAEGWLMERLTLPPALTR
ncbi:MAG: hypothetical protein ABFR97_09955 [Thermodesulfobacteriota bacterium]